MEEEEEEGGGGGGGVVHRSSDNDDNSDLSHEWATWLELGSVPSPKPKLRKKEDNQADIPHARFQRTDQWRPVYSWLESLDKDEVVKSKDIIDWLTENPEVQEQLCSRHSRSHLMHYIKKCHMKILKRKDKRKGSQQTDKPASQKGLQQSEKPVSLKVNKDVVMKQPTRPVVHLSNNAIDLPKDSDAYLAKQKEALQKYEIGVGEVTFPIFEASRTNQMKNFEYQHVKHNYESSAEKMKCLNYLWLNITLLGLVHFPVAHSRGSHGGDGDGVQPLSKIAIHRAVYELHENASVKTLPLVLGTKGEDFQWIDVKFESPKPSDDDWIAVFSPANSSFVFFSSTCPATDIMEEAPYICSAPIKVRPFEVSVDQSKRRFLLRIVLRRVIKCIRNWLQFSNSISFANPKAPLYPRLAQGRSWNEMSVTWTSGYDINEAVPFVEWGFKGRPQIQSPAGTLTFGRNSMCGTPARTFGWRDPGFIHTSFLMDLWPNSKYSYKLGHMLHNGTIIWSKTYYFKSSPYPGQIHYSVWLYLVTWEKYTKKKIKRDGSNEYSNYQPGSLNTTDQIIKDLDNIDIVFHIGDISYANGYISQWDHGNHERDVPGSGSFYDGNDSGGECGVLAENMFYVPAENRAKFWYSTKFGMFHFCIADSEHDWREGSEHSSGFGLFFVYWKDGSFGEPMGRESLQKLWQKYKVDIAFFGHVHNYERTCPITRINYKKSSDGNVYDSFTISRDYRDVLACVYDGCEPTT
ncbi:hypothetical protein F8388_007636 [Cannabis sativa]|uniref:Purple acid phosphatase n=1 Tax=Cannabis sativa TaxID=3483 RepID=A0A7J6EVA7_CANSA|nr:hypothetical protein F8388_007636 [Cannabis sativa]